MKRKALSIFLFVIAFISTYILLCFHFTGGKMALEATALDYIRVAITYMPLFKIVISLAVAFFIGAIPAIVERK